jgi:hypothetical protein
VKPVLGACTLRIRSSPSTTFRKRERLRQGRRPTCRRQRGLPRPHHELRLPIEDVKRVDVVAVGVGPDTEARTEAGVDRLKLGQFDENPVITRAPEDPLSLVGTDAHACHGGSSSQSRSACASFGRARECLRECCPDTRFRPPSSVPVPIPLARDRGKRECCTTGSRPCARGKPQAVVVDTAIAGWDGCGHHGGRLPCGRGYSSSRRRRGGVPIRLSRRRSRARISRAARLGGW